jgi:hypothetical protein
VQKELVLSVLIFLAVPKIVRIEDDCLETNVRPASCGVDAIDRRDVLREPSVGIVPFS